MVHFLIINCVINNLNARSLSSTFLILLKIAESNKTILREVHIIGVDRMGSGFLCCKQGRRESSKTIAAVECTI
jgi:hypothetical protein